MAPKEPASCTVFEIGPGKYSVISSSDSKPGTPDYVGVKSRHYVPPGKHAGDYSQLVRKPHIVVQGTPGLPENKLTSSIDAVVKGIESDVASHKDWSPFKLETVAEIIKQTRGVSGVSVKRPSTSS